MPQVYKRIQSVHIPAVAVAYTEAEMIDFLFDKQCVISLFSLTAKSSIVLRNALLPRSHMHFY